MSCWSCWAAERRGVATGREEGWQAERKRATTRAEQAARADRARPLLRNLIQRLDDVVEIGRVDLRGAGLARARGERVGAGLAEADALFFLAVVELHEQRQHGRVETGFGGRLAKHRRAPARAP